MINFDKNQAAAIVHIVIIKNTHDLQSIPFLDRES